MKGLHVTVKGSVQGVGYRQFVRQQARTLGLTGWVQNMPDSTVEAKVFGPLNSIAEFIKRCKKGPFLSEVKDVIVTEIESDNAPTDFTILHS